MSISFPSKGLKPESFASQALRVAVAAADGSSNAGTLMLIVAVVFILVLIGACFLDLKFLKDSASDADQSRFKPNTKLLEPRQEPSPVSSTTPGSVAWRSFKTGQSMSGPPSQKDAADAQRNVHFERVSVSTGAAYSNRNLGSAGRLSDGSRSSSAHSAASPPPSQSTLQLEASRPAGPPTHRAPPTFCKALILPHEARFMIPMSSLADRNSTWEVLGYSGRPLLKATRREMDGGARQFVEIAMTPPRSPILAYAGSFPSSTPGMPSCLRILGAGGAPYGDLKQSPTGQQYHLMVEDQETHTIIADSSGQLIFYGADGVNLATVSRSSDGGKSSVEIRVIPEVDSILVLSCVLAILIFGGDAGTMRKI